MVVGSGSTIILTWPVRFAKRLSLLCVARELENSEKRIKSSAVLCKMYVSRCCSNLHEFELSMDREGLGHEFFKCLCVHREDRG